MTPKFSASSFLSQHRYFATCETQPALAAYKFFFGKIPIQLRVFDKLSISDGNAALINEKSLNQLNRELREVNRT